MLSLDTDSLKNPIPRDSCNYMLEPPAITVPDPSQTDVTRVTPGLTPEEAEFGSDRTTPKYILHTFGCTCHGCVRRQFAIQGHKTNAH